jgi:hypothetical protein
MVTGWFQDAPSLLAVLDEELVCRQACLDWRKRLSPASEGGRLAVLLAEKFLLDHTAGLADRPREGRATFGSAGSMEIFGWRPENVVGKRLHDIHHHWYPGGSPCPHT